MQLEIIQRNTEKNKSKFQVTGGSHICKPENPTSAWQRITKT